MYVEWTKHLSDQEDKDHFKQEVYAAKRVLDRIKQICEEKETALNRSERSISVYDTPNWNERQAHKNGNYETLTWLKQLVDLDIQRIDK